MGIKIYIGRRERVVQMCSARASDLWGGHNVWDAFFTPAFPMTSALRARLTVFAVLVRSSRRPGPSMLPDNMNPSSSMLDAMNLSSLDTGGGIGLRVGWKNRPGLLDDDEGEFIDIGLTWHDW